MKYKCLVCGQILDTNEKCPVCGAGPDKIVPFDDKAALVWADEHTLGVAKGVDSEIYEGLLQCFQAEITEVGMYLAMARLAYREGYPEIGEVFKTIAWEEALHAAHFEELAGDKIESTTKANIEKMINGENGACDFRVKLAKRAKELNLDAIHDAVHEIGKDEARHGKALAGLLKRYFA